MVRRSSSETPSEPSFDCSLERTWPSMDHDSYCSNIHDTNLFLDLNKDCKQKELSTRIQRQKMNNERSTREINSSPIQETESNELLLYLGKLLGDAPHHLTSPPIFLRHLCIFLLIIASPRRSARAAPIPESDDHMHVAFLSLFHHSSSFSSFHYFSSFYYFDSDFWYIDMHPTLAGFYPFLLGSPARCAFLSYLCLYICLGSPARSRLSRPQSPLQKPYMLKSKTLQDTVTNEVNHRQVHSCSGCVLGQLRTT